VCVCVCVCVFLFRNHRHQPHSRALLISAAQEEIINHVATSFNQRSWRLKAAAYRSFGVRVRSCGWALPAKHTEACTFL
jgi:hypothetical protein